MPASGPSGGSGSYPARVFFICTANRARSPFAAALLRRHVAPLDVRVESFGTLERSGAPALLPSVRAARAFGIDLRTHRSRALEHGALEGADLVLGFESFHVASAVVVGGAARSRSFLLTELADVLGSLARDASGPTGTFDALVAHADARRRAEAVHARPLVDPVGGPDRRHFEVYERIDRLVEIVAARLFGAAVTRTG